jgi:GTP-binding protein EngB required for normal cell division
MPTLLTDHRPALAAHEFLPPPPAHTDGGGAGGLRSYHAAKLALAAQLRLLREALKMRGDERGQRRCEDLLLKLAEDRFTLAVLGQFKRGKSSLLTALVGRELLPVGVLPLTSAITVVRFGARERLLVERWSGSNERDRTYTTEEPIGRLADFVTERGNPGNCLRVKAATLETPTPFLRRGVEFVDTPGVGSAIEANTATTRGFLPSCDAALFVTSAEAPLSETELMFLGEIRQHVRKLFFVVNKTDLLAPAEQAAVVGFTARILREQTGAKEVRVFPLSSRLGLQGARQSDAGLLRQSGLPALQAALAEFLAGERTQTFLRAVIDKTLRLLDRTSWEETLGALARTLPEPARREKLAALEHRLRAHGAARATIIGRLRAEFVQAAHMEAGRIAGTGQADDEAMLVRHFDRLLSHCGWRSSRDIWRRMGRKLARLHARRERGRQPENAVLAMAGQILRGLPALVRLRENLRFIPHLAAEISGFTPPLPLAGDDPLPPWDARDDGTRPPPPNPLPPTPLRATAWLPARWQRHRMRAALQRHLPAYFETRRQELEDWTADRVGRAFDCWAAAADAAADSLAARARALLDHSAPVISDAADLDSVRRGLRELEMAINASPETAAPALPLAAEAPEPPIPPAPPTDIGEAVGSVTQTLGTRGCPVCDQLVAAAGRIFSQWQYDLYAREEVQRDYADKGNLCALHLWQLEAMSSPVGVSVGHAKRVERVARALEEASVNPATRPTLAAQLPRSDNCHVCAQLRAVETSQLGQLADLVRTPEGRAHYARSHGPCLRHLLLLVAHGADESVRAFLFAEAARRFAETAEDMQTFGLKTEALRRGLRNQDEDDAWWRALTHLAGARRLAGAPTCDGKI